MTGATETKVSFCRTCEAMCGVLVDVEDNRVVKIRPDKDHVVSRGYSCMKGLHFDEIHHSPDRLLEPIRRDGDRWETTPWDGAIADIGARLRRIVDQHGPDAVGHFVGSPGGANVLAPMFRGALWAAIGSRRMYGTGTCDTMNKFRVNDEMYGSPMRLAYPDVTRTELLIVLGANPVVSGNTLYHLPAAARQFKAIGERGGRVVFVNPRRIESAKTGEHIFIRPDTDLFFLATFVNELIQRGAVDRAHVDRHMRGFVEVAAAVATWTPERQAAVTGVPARTLTALVDAHIAANGAALYMATGVNQGRNGSLCFWLLEVINAVTGNLDRVGGTLMGSGLMDMAAKMKNQLGTTFDRDDGFPTVSGQQPAGLLADDIESGRVRALIVEASNPLLACPNPDGRLTRALGQLDLLVCIDLFRNETGNLADYVLPAPTWLERDEIPYALQSFAGCTPTPYITYVDAAVEPAPGVRHEWWIYTRIADAMGVTLFGNRAASAAAKLNARLAGAPRTRNLTVGPRVLLDRMLQQGKLPGRKAFLRDHPHGLLLAQHPGHDFLGTERVLTDDGRVDLAPGPLVAEFVARAEAAYQAEWRDRDRIKLIGKREMNRINTTSSNAPGLVKALSNVASVHPDDAARYGLTDGESARVSSAFGSITIPVKVTEEMMPGTVAIPQCWGHENADGLGHAVRHPGVNSNLLAGDGAANTEPLSGMSHLSGIVVDLVPAKVIRDEAASATYGATRS